MEAGMLAEVSKKKAPDSHLNAIPALWVERTSSDTARCKAPVGEMFGLCLPMF